MVQGGSASTRAASAREPVRRKLVQRHDLPPRVRHMLTGLLGLCTRSLADSMGAALDEFEHELLRQAAKARTIEQSRRCFDTLREFKRTRGEAVPRFLVAIEDGLARFDESGHPQHAEPPQSSARQAAELSLVETSDLEESLVLQEMVMKSDVRQSLALHDLGHRFGVLAEQPAFDAESVPLGPSRVAAALRDVGAGMNVPPEHRALFYRAYDRVALSEAGTFYAALNSFLAEHRILRNLRVHSPARPKSKSGDRVGEAAESRNEATSISSGGVWAARSSSEGHDTDMFTTLRELLAGRRQMSGSPAAARDGSGYVPSAEDVQAVLGKLQTRPGAARYTVAQLKQDLLNQLRQRAPAGQRAQLNSEDSDTIDLVGMLFECITKNTPAAGNTQAMLTKLHVPLLRVALQDKNFFTQQAHPARLLLNAIAETGIHWIDDSEGEADPALLKKMHVVIERLNSEFNGDLSLIERMFGDLSQHMQTLKHKAEMAERRLVDASKGREKLALARETASNAIAELVSAGKPGRLLRTMLEQAWTDVLALTLLRQGENSAAYREQLAVAGQLIAAGSPSSVSEKPPHTELRQQVEKALGQVGYHHDEIQLVVRRLLAPAEVANEDNPASQTDIAIRLKSKSHLGEVAGEEKPLRAAELRKASMKLSDEEIQLLEHLKTIPFGTWFEFATNQQGDRVRRKLSWFSTVTGRCLFVNQRGARVQDRTLEQLARDIVRGQANIAEPEHESLVDRAWNAIVASLKQLTGQAVNARPVPA